LLSLNGWLGCPIKSRHLGESDRVFCLRFACSYASRLNEDSELEELPESRLCSNWLMELDEDEVVELDP
jgi:hypothetical protein